MKLSKKFLFFVPVLAGVFLLVTTIKNRQGPVRPDLAEISRPVNVVRISPITIAPTATGYGYVQPTETWDAIPEVGGRVVEIHPELKKGTFVSRGDLLVKIDTQVYGLAESRGEASVMSIDAQIKELEQQRINNEKLLNIEKRALELAHVELERKRKLFSDGLIAASELDLEEKNLLAQQSQVDNLQNILELIPSQERALLAQKQSDESSLSESRLNIEKTIITAPFDCRISEVNIELNQYAPAGTTLLTAVNISAVEIPVQLSPSSFASLLSAPENKKTVLLGADMNMDKIRELIGLTAKVRLPLFNRKVEWDGVFRRTADSIDPATGAIPVYVAVYNPLGQVIPGVRPPLIPNMYTEVELTGKPRKNKIVIPFSAVHEGNIYYVNEEKRLTKTAVEVELVLGNMAVIKTDLPSDTMVVTTDLVPAIDDMLLAPQLDEQMMADISNLDVSNK